MADHQRAPKIKVIKDGPYLVTGNIPMTDQTIIADHTGRSVRWEEGNAYPEQESYTLCRCGHSKHSPYCDGTHQQIDFKGTEGDQSKSYLDQAEAISGPDLILTDVTKLCAYARFCHREEGGVWELTEQSDDPKLRESAIRGTWDCPAGRLIAWDKETGESIEPKSEPSVGIIEDPPKGVSGPIWVKGGVPVESSEGELYEVRNQVTLCRCGRSRNKPFCDGTHAAIGYKGKKK